MRGLFCFILMSSLGGLSSYAKEKPYVVLAQVEKDGFVSQHSVRFHRKEIEFALNDNFLCGRFDSAFLGKFAIKDTETFEPFLVSSRHIVDRVGHSRHPSSAHPHSIQWSIGKRDVTHHKGYRSIASGFIKKTCGSEKSALDGVYGKINKDSIEFSFYKNQKLSRKESIPLQKSGCRLSSVSRGTKTKLYRCRVPGYGQMTLTQRNL